jgi:hypothetical protein
LFHARQILFQPTNHNKKKGNKKKNLVGYVIKENMLIEPKLRIVITKAGKSAASLSRAQGMKTAHTLKQ